MATATAAGSAELTSRDREIFENTLLKKMNLKKWEDIEYWCRLFPWVRKHIPDETYYKLQTEEKERLRKYLNDQLTKKKEELIKIKEELKLQK